MVGHVPVRSRAQRLARADSPDHALTFVEDTPSRPLSGLIEAATERWRLHLAAPVRSAPRRRTRRRLGVTLRVHRWDGPHRAATHARNAEQNREIRTCDTHAERRACVGGR